MRAMAMRLGGVLAFLCVAACGHFQGPGPYKTGGDYPPPAAQATNEPLAQADSSDSESMDEEAPHSASFFLHWPVSNVRITQPFEPPKNHHHKGLDLGGLRDTPIYAAHDGRVIYTGRDFHGYGNMVLLEFDKEWATLYAHLRKIRVREGQYVHTGSALGSMGRTGHATGVHLHFELMHRKQPIDPLIYLRNSQSITSRTINQLPPAARFRAAKMGG